MLVTGGQSAGLALASAELYDPSTGMWTATGSMNTARSLDTATLLQKGKVLVAGGLGSSSAASSAELYDPATGTWSATGSLSTARNDQTATLLQNGEVLVAGGEGPSAFALASAELYTTGERRIGWWQRDLQRCLRWQREERDGPGGRELHAGVGDGRDRQRPEPGGVFDDRWGRR